MLVPGGGSVSSLSLLSLLRTVTGTGRRFKSPARTQAPTLAAMQQLTKKRGLNDKTMKKTITIICLTIVVMVTNSCNEKDFDLQNPNVGQFVSLLKTGNYFEKVGYELPNFSINDIGELIKYLGDTTEIAGFPVNPVSSKLTFPKILNECIMWTIEGIRLEKKYASLEPALRDKSTNYSRLTNKQLIIMSEKYLDWYNEYKANPSETVRKKDLLENTTYTWD